MAWSGLQDDSEDMDVNNAISKKIGGPVLVVILWKQAHRTNIWLIYHRITDAHQRAICYLPYANNKKRKLWWPKRLHVHERRRLDCTSTTFNNTRIKLSRFTRWSVSKRFDIPFIRLPSRISSTFNVVGRSFSPSIGMQREQVHWQIEIESKSALNDTLNTSQYLPIITTTNPTPILLVQQPFLPHPLAFYPANYILLVIIARTVSSTSPCLPPVLRKK